LGVELLLCTSGVVEVVVDGVEKLLILLERAQKFVRIMFGHLSALEELETRFVLNIDFVDLGQLIFGFDFPEVFIAIGLFE
jgi:hypothetical protein